MLAPQPGKQDYSAPVRPCSPPYQDALGVDSDVPGDWYGAVAKSSNQPTSRRWLPVIDSGDRGQAM